SMSNPAQGVGLLFAEILPEIGIRVGGPVQMGATTLSPTATVLAEIEGLSVREQLGRMLRFSNNYIADVLTLNLAASVQKAPPTNLSSASRVLSDFLSRTQRSIGRPAAEDAPVLLSGSGLTPENRLSAIDLVSLLSYEYRDS